MMKSVFVTVGSTSFDSLIETLSTESSLELLKTHGFNRITFQIGDGTFIPPQASEETSPEIEWYRFKDNLSEDIRSSSLIIGHAGAGTILESLLEGKQIVVVLNERLMDNHQCELAEKLASEGYLQYSSTSKLVDTLREALKNDSLRACFKPARDVFYPVLESVLELK